MPQLVSEVALRDEMFHLSGELERLEAGLREKRRSGRKSARQHLDGPSNTVPPLLGRRTTPAGMRDTRDETPPSPATTRAQDPEATTVQTRRLSLPGYDGEADWVAFEAQLDAVANYENWSDAETAVQLCLVLRGPALRVLVRLPAEDRNALAPLKAALRSRFGWQPEESTAKQLLARRRRVQGEGLRVLASKLALLVHLAYPLFESEAQHQLALDFFLGAV
ncbi:uncharacterized protein LOC143485380 [Brachyhypopomus gauderio]|uniref:uncharacterized protein LOC143485380 n=1 Tax=Brachyhypopomus gauderio TaxID=698409 RepID=UPI0040424383